jgi:poly(A) polymerase
MQRLESTWLTLPALTHLFSLFEAAGATLRLVGGSVRDGLLNLPVSDIDFAVDRDPHWVMDLLKQNHIKVVPTGIDHGTVTAVIEKRPYQITTLRRDIETFGRKANVAFTDDWVEDAQRRDFTMNAIYADKNGNLFDPVGGLQDLLHHRVRFIGDASLRIKEDYLRILRFFRFSARFGHEPYDAEGLKAAKTYASHLPHLARERVTEEFLKLMELPSPLYTLEAMHETGVLSYILHPGTWEDLKSLVILENETKVNPSAMLRLAAFHPLVDEVKKHLRLSNKQESALNFYIKDHPLIEQDSFKQQAYRWSKDGVFKLALLQTARRLTASEVSPEEGVTFLNDLHQQYDDWGVPAFPISGTDLLDRGVKEGHDVGRLLKALEKWWLSQDLEPDREACLAQLSTLL